ncbi:ATP-binding protein [Streptomyces sp. NBC_01352]|uniref:ATP-binding protein n=1 Tax=Streptomyces sp. NBC_01352 TaxID=2903834 RepID=UPI002E31D5B7|nr:ATP-binding protein [Streptomyces sp. NBC_01352]
MDIDTSQPWGVAIDYAGRATVVEDGHAIHVNVSDASLSSIIAPDPLTGRHASVTVTAQFSETDGSGAVLRGGGRVTVQPTGTDPVVPDQTAVQRAVAAALVDFRANTEKYAALCATWTSPSTPDPDTDTDTETGTGTGTATT